MSNPQPIKTRQITLGTWNVRGLASNSKRETLAIDCKNYNVDILCIQETKTKDYWEQTLPSGYKLILLEQKDGYHGGLGFVVGPRLVDYITGYKYITDRIAKMDLVIPTRNGTTTNLRIVNAYGPTSERAAKDPALLHAFYAELSSTLTTPARWLTFICGDFNSKLGKLTTEDIDADLRSCVGSYSVGKRNSNGEALIDFLSTQGYFACNTAFQHPCRHRTTWTGFIKDPRNDKKTRPIYNQIDFILCQQRATCLLRDSRAYAGTETNSDHKLVTTKLFMDNLHLLYKQKPKDKGHHKVNIEHLNKDHATQQAYQATLKDALSKQSLCNDDPNQTLSCLINTMKNAAIKTAGEVKSKSSQFVYSNDPLVAELSKKQKALRIQIHQRSRSEDRSDLRRERNAILRQISKRLKEIATQQADTLADEITNTDDCRKMFRAAKQLKVMKPLPPTTVHDADGNFIGTDKGKAEAIKSWFHQQFTDQQDEPLQPFIGEPKPLQQPVTKAEVEVAITSLQNGRAAGSDEINSELFKHAKYIVSEHITSIINSSFKNNKPIDTLGEGIMITLPKPKKPPGPPANLRPIVLLNSIRKIMSIITLHRIRDKVDRFTGPYQSGFKRGRSCADIVWAQRMLVSVVMTKKWDFHKMGIDMSKAFDTIKRKRILDVLHEAGCNEDELRLVRSLLASTRLKVRVNSELSAEFETTIGSPQGDSLSPVLFTCYLAAALRSVRNRSTRPNPPVSEIGMPLEMEYADDVDFLDEEKVPLDTLQPIAAEDLKEHNLFMNEAKTEHTHVYLAEKSEIDDDDQPCRNNESWRKSKTLGSLLCSTADIKSRCILGNIAFNSLRKIWSRKSKIPLDRRLLLYNAYCASIMLYNCSSWSVPKGSLDRLDTCQRRHLRIITGHGWPKSLISNRALYELCRCEPFSHQVKRQRWSMLGHVLRMDPEIPAQRALEFAISGSKKYQARQGRHYANLLEQIRADIKQAGLGLLRTKTHLDKLRIIAKDKYNWKQLRD